ncbi:solute carrier family 25 member 35-like [Lineus longissimus]|uniref:solute carrier family 25 member 35-like n=1 Tax=Lineus longissimus TaxID=88925 RepID=UPI00315DEB28
MPNNCVEFVLGGMAACGAGFFTNPLEVVKTRMQIQGELLARGMYTKHYRNVFHAFYVIAKCDGVTALQRGLVPALYYQLVMNSLRLGTFQVLTNRGFTKDANGTPSFPRMVVAGAVSGCVGAAFGSPFYLVKTHLQNRTTHSEIAVGHQHQHSTMSLGFRKIYKKEGVKGLWRGVDAAVTRVMIGSAMQLSTFSYIKHWMETKEVFKKDSTMNAFIASVLGGFAVVAVMTPPDVVTTRLYNQEVDAKGRGVLYRNLFDCFQKIFRKEGLFGFYKGWAASLIRLAPHSILSLVFWDELRLFYYKHVEVY